MSLAARTPVPLGMGEGTVVGGYTLQRALDSPVAAELRYAASDPDGARATVIAPAHWQPDRRRRSEFRRLASRRVKLTHPAVIRAHDFGEHRGRPYLITDPYPPSTFSEILEREAPLPPRRAVTMLAPIADALDAAHGRELVHRALSSDSLLARDGDLQLDSFGLFTPEYDAALGMVPPGDLRYRPPEELRGEPVGPGANVYSLTAVLVHALTGAPPFVGERGAVTYSHLLEPPPGVSEQARELPGAIDDVIAWGMAKQPAERPPTATSLLLAVTEVLDTGSARVPARPVEGTPPALPTRVVRPARPAATRAVTVATVLLAAATGALAAAALDPFAGSDDSRPAPTRPARAVERLDAQRVDLRSRLAVADTPEDQAAIAAQLATAYRDAAQAAPPGPFAQAAAAAANAYTELANASEAGNAERFAAASEAVERSELRLQTRR